MNRSLGLQWFSARSALVLCLCAALAQSALWADGVTRMVDPVPGGCRVTLAWAFSGKVGSDLILEERFARGWSVDSATVPFSSFDATWFSGTVARFAVKSAQLAEPGSVSFLIRSGDESVSGTVAGDWQIYLGGTLRKGTVAGVAVLPAASGTAANGDHGPSTADSADGQFVDESLVAIASFRFLSRSRIEMSYVGLAKSGTLVVDGCEGIGKPWTEVKRVAEVPAGNGTVDLTEAEVGGCRFFRIRFLAKGE